MLQWQGIFGCQLSEESDRKVIDAEKDEKSLRQDVGFTSIAHTKTANFLTLYGHTASIPLLAEENTDCWSEFDIHLNSEVFYLSGSMYASDSCLYRVEERLKSIQPLREDSVLILSGQERWIPAFRKYCLFRSTRCLMSVFRIYRAMHPLLWWQM